MGIVGPNGQPVVSNVRTESFGVGTLEFVTDTGFPRIAPQAAQAAQQLAGLQSVVEQMLANPSELASGNAIMAISRHVTGIAPALATAIELINNLLGYSNCLCQQSMKDRDRADALQGRIAALEDRLASLEAPVAKA